MRERNLPYVLIIAAAIACAEVTPTAEPHMPATVVTPSFALNPAYGLQYFHITGFSYGPNWEEYDPGTCHGTYNFTDDSVQVWSGTPPAYVKTEKWDRVGCAIGQPTDGPYVGGSVAYQITNSDVYGAVVADGVAEAWLFDVPKDPAGSLYLNATPHGGYQFVQWVITPTSGGSYFDTNSSITRTLGTTDYAFRAEFKKNP